MAKYTTEFFYPNKLGLFSAYGKDINDKAEIYNKFQSADKDFWISFGILAVVFGVGMKISVVGTLWYFVVIALHSQWRMTGQFYAQRYHYLAIVGLCVVAGTAIQHYPLLVTIVATALVIRTYLFIPAFKDIESLYRSDLDAFPDNSQCYNSLGQFYLNSSSEKNPLPAWRVNEIGALLFKAEQMNPDDWSIKMNVACFFAMLGQWPQTMAKTVESLKLVKPLGGIDVPVKILEQQVKNLTNILDQHKAQAKANIVQNLETAVTSSIALIREMNNSALDPIQKSFEYTLETIRVKKPELGFNMCMDISSELNALIGMIEKDKIVSDPDIIQIKSIVGQILEARKKLTQPQVAAIISPTNELTAQKVGIDG